MKCELDISSEELADLDVLLQREAQASRSELRRTRNPQFRSELEHHVERVEHLLGLLTRCHSPGAAN